MSRTALVALLGLLLVHEASAAAKCMEFTFKPTKGECKDKETKYKRCVSDTTIANAAALATSDATKTTYERTMQKLERDPEDYTDEALSLTKGRCAAHLHKNYAMMISAMAGICGTKPGTDDASPESMGSLKLNGVSKVPYGPPGAKCDCKKYSAAIIGDMFASVGSNAECDKDEDCRAMTISNVEVVVPRLCCDSTKESVDKWCKDYDEAKVTALKTYYSNLDEATQGNKCYEDKCITYTSSASSALPHLLFSALLALLALAKLY